jgi:F-type H+-transporting ATPase subunit a
MRNRILAILGVLLVVGIGLYVIGIRSTKLSVKVAPEPVVCLFGERESVERCASGIPITDSEILTIIVVIALLGVTAAATGKLRALDAKGLQNARSEELVPRGLQNVMELMVEALYNFGKSVDPKNIHKFFPVAATIFFFFLFSNYSGLIPGVGNIGLCVAEHGAGHSETSAESAVKEEPKQADFFANWPGTCAKGTVLVPFVRSPSTDLNVTFAFGIVAVLMVQVFGFQALGMGYLTKFFNFKEGFMGAFVGILELISEFVRIIAFAFRLFGNLFAGKTVILVMTFLFPYLLPLPFYGLEVFVAFIQAVVFAALTMVFMSLAVIPHGGHDHAHGDEGHAKGHH